MDNLNVTLLTPITWAENSELNAEQLDCITAVVLKILDRKCKMTVYEQEAMLALYDLLHPVPAKHFDDSVHRAIDKALRQEQMDETTRDKIHRLRLQAEAVIPKPVMKAFKARLRQELFKQAG
jgi:hypothetical protein